METLEILSLGGNNISDINVFANMHFKSLKKLYLEYNSIKDIKPLDLAKFDKLERLHLYPHSGQYETEKNLRNKIKDVCFHSD